jgi:2-polyprenyl-6-methoxyphenol hydroxylase-like FAD-dependent oxidoreductase
VTTVSTDVLVVGAGPTGLTLAAQLLSFGASFRIVDRQLDRVHESRALAVQPRTLEVLTGLGVADAMVERGNSAVRLQMHTGARTTEVPLFDIGLDDTAYPFLLFLSQAETEAILAGHLAQRGATVERGVELVDLRQEPDCVACTLRQHSGQTEDVTARYVVGRRCGCGTRCGRPTSGSTIATPPATDPAVCSSPGTPPTSTAPPAPRA